MPRSPALASADLLRWRDVAAWRPRLFAALRPVLRPALGRYALGSPMTEAFRETLRSEEARECLLTMLPRLYARLRVYHGTRTADPGAFYRDGLRLATADGMRERLRAIFLGGRYPTLTADDLEAAVAEIDESGRLGRVYVAIDRRELLESCGHYLVYGSEFVASVAVRLEEKVRAGCQEQLTSVGLPTILTFDLPFSLFDDDELREIAGTFLEELISQQEDPGGAALSADCYVLRQPVPPTYLVAHEHPERVLDPLRGMVAYRWRSALAAGRIDHTTLPSGIADLVSDPRV